MVRKPKKLKTPALSHNRTYLLSIFGTQLTKIILRGRKLESLKVIVGAPRQSTIEI